MGWVGHGGHGMGFSNIFVYIYGDVSLVVVSPGAPQEHRYGSRTRPADLPDLWRADRSRAQARPMVAGSRPAGGLTGVVGSP